MLKRFFIFVMFILSIGLGLAADNRNFFLQKSQPQHIFINNTILAKVNGKAISVIDLMKKMDMIFYKRFPQYSSSVEARYQFYNVNWKHVMEELIEKELIMADAEEMKIEVTNGDVRQEMENMFGPNIIANLDKAGITYEEAWKIVKEDQILKRMMMIRVNSKAIRSVTPIKIKTAYEEFAKNNTNLSSWHYSVISLRGKDAPVCLEVANRAYTLLAEEGVLLSDLAKSLETYLSKEMVNCTVSEEYHHTEKELSESYREILALLEPGNYSKPISQKGRDNKSDIVRIFYLKEFNPGGAPPFSVVETKLKNQLIDKKVDEEATLYVDKLRKHFDIQEVVFSENFQPFVLK
jgi:SurA N-terminal domain